MARREFLGLLASVPVGVAMASRSEAASSNKRLLNIVMKSAWGSDDPTKAAFAFLHGHALAEAGHQVRIFLLGEAVSIMREAVAQAIVPVGWPPLIGTLRELARLKIPIYACGACSRARGVTEADLHNFGASFGNPTIFVSLVEWADRVISE